MDWTKIESEAVADLTALLKFDTTNPPGNETAAIAWIAAAIRAGSS